MSGHGNTGHHRGRTQAAARRVEIEQAIARHGTPYKAAEKLGLPDEVVLAVWRELLEIGESGDDTLARPIAVCRHPCGTYAAYQFHESHGEPVDDACRAEASRRRAQYRREAAA